MMQRNTALCLVATIGTTIAGPLSASEGLKIDAGADLTARLDTPVQISGTVSKDASIGWTLVEGPGDVVFGEQHSASTSATFSESGEYTLMLGGYDGDIVWDFVQVTVTP